MAIESKRILLADDDLDALETMSILLRQLGHEVFLASSGEAALLSAQANRPHLILLDIGMPDMDGWEVGRQLRAAHGPDGVRIIAVTGRAEGADYRRSREAGFDAHVAKPIDFALLQSMLREIR